MMKKILKKLLRTEKGQSLPMVLILMAVSGLILAPLLSYTSSGLKVGKTYERIADEFYAADAGIEDGLWQINYNHLNDIIDTYQRYEYGTEYTYPPSYPIEVNDTEVTVKIKNIWIPKDIPAPEYDDAEDLIGAGKLIITSGVSAELTEQVKIYYYKDDGDATLLVNEIGIWLPPGFSYNPAGECTLETWLDADPDADYTRESTPHKGGKAIVWTFNELLPFTSLPGVNEMETPMTCTFTFPFLPDDPASERIPEAVSWTTTTGVDDIRFTWDADVRVFRINSQAGGTTIDAYAIKSDLRELVSGISGDYRAIGNTMMLNLNYDPYGPVRDYLLDDSDATTDDIPANAQVTSALLYWSAWILGDGEQTTIFSDNCNDINNGNWYIGSDWEQYWSWWTGVYAFQAHHDYGGGRELEMVAPIELSIYDSGTVTAYWDYWISGNIEPGDCLQYAFHDGSGWSGWENVFCGDDWPDGASDWSQTFEASVPDECLTDNFRIKFRITSFDGSGWGGTEVCYIDNIEVAAEVETLADTEVTFKIDGDQVYFADDEYGHPTVPTEGIGSIYANGTGKVLPNEDPETGYQNGYSYSCKADVTALVQEFTEHGNATYTVGDIYGDINSQWSYAGWSLIIIYSSPETQRHQLFSFDNFLYIAPHSGGLSFDIGGFLVPDPIPGEVNAAKITCFVGDGDDFYSGDFIAINAPEGLEGPQINNSYKLWDGITLAAPSWPPYMPNNSSSPNNVWNGRSEGFGGSFIDGVDIDTFYVPWGDPPSGGLLKPGDSSATIALNFAGTSGTAELINFIYIIISFRSRAVTGGTISYIIDS